MPNETCSNPAVYRYTWPGRDEQTICKQHAQKLRQIASAIGLHIQLIETSSGVCTQIITTNHLQNPTSETNPNA